MRWLICLLCVSLFFAVQKASAQTPPPSKKPPQTPAPAPLPERMPAPPAQPSDIDQRSSSGGSTPTNPNVAAPGGVTGHSPQGSTPATPQANVPSVQTRLLLIQQAAQRLEDLFENWFGVNGYRIYRNYLQYDFPMADVFVLRSLQAMENNGGMVESVLNNVFVEPWISHMRTLPVQNSRTGWPRLRVNQDVTLARLHELQLLPLGMVEIYRQFQNLTEAAYTNRANAKQFGVSWRTVDFRFRELYSFTLNFLVAGEQAVRSGNVRMGRWRVSRERTVNTYLARIRNVAAVLNSMYDLFYSVHGNLNQLGITVNRQNVACWYTMHADDNCDFSQRQNGNFFSIGYYNGQNNRTYQAPRGVQRVIYNAEVAPSNTRLQEIQTYINNQRNGSSSNSNSNSQSQNSSGLRDDY